jgi:hypothetical protein
MEPITTAILSIGGLIIPPAFDFLKKKFIKSSNDTPERTMSSLATTNPDVLPQYVSSMATYLQAQTAYFNRDVVGTPSQIVIDLRAVIRPLSVIIGFVLLGAEMFGTLQLDPATRGSIILNNSSWFGSRIVQN